ncbi:hypothetical protein ACP70R_020351 [Stipagrostis hirtigluma subsp. patula]
MIPMASADHGDNGDDAILPTHTAVTSSKPVPARNARRRRLCACHLVTLAVLLALAATALVLYLTVLRVRDPTARLVSARLAGVAPRLSFHPRSVQLNVTLLLTVAVHNPNAASFAYTSGHASLTYRGASVGEAELVPGRVPSRGDGEARLAVTVQADRLAAHFAQLVADVERGSVAMEASTIIPGKVTILGVFKRHAVTYSECRFVFGVAELKVRSQECNGRTKL